MAGGVKLKDRDNGYQALVKRVFRAKRPVIDVGILAAEGGQPKDGGGGVTVIQVAQWMEFGTSRIPARSFIRAWFDDNQDRARNMVVAVLQQVIKGAYTSDVGLERLGQKFVSEIQARISAGVPPPLAASTVAQKGSSTPLIDTGQLRSSITYRVRYKGA